MICRKGQEMEGETYNVAKMKRTFLGSSLDEPGRLKLFLLKGNLPSGAVVLLTLPAVMVIWWWICGLLPPWSRLVPTAVPTAFSGVLDPFGEEEAAKESLSFPTEFIFFSTLWDPFRERLRCNVILEFWIWLISLLGPWEKLSMSITKLSDLWSETEIFCGVIFSSEPAAASKEDAGISFVFSAIFRRENEGGAVELWIAYTMRQLPVPQFSQFPPPW